MPSARERAGSARCCPQLFLRPRGCRLLKERETTVVGESTAAVRLHLGDKRIIELGVFKPDWDAESGNNNGEGKGLGEGIGTWYLSIPLRKAPQGAAGARVQGQGQSVAGERRLLVPRNDIREVRNLCQGMDISWRHPY